MIELALTELPCSGVSIGVDTQYLTVVQSTTSVRILSVRILV
jgi:hypothetical protein